MHIFPFFHHSRDRNAPHRPLSRPSRIWLSYGLYTVLCQLIMILLHTRIDVETIASPCLSLRYAPMLEHALMSLTVLAIGAYLVERTLLESRK